jgi:hypothetical protein
METRPDKAALKRKKSKLNQSTASALEISQNTKKKTTAKKPNSPGKAKSAFEAISSEKKPKKIEANINSNFERHSENFYNQQRGTFRAHIPNQYLQGPNYGQNPESLGREEYLGRNKRHSGIGIENYEGYYDKNINWNQENFNRSSSRYVEIPYVKGNLPPHPRRHYYQEAYTQGDSRRDQNYMREFRTSQPRYGEDYSNELYNPNWDYQRGYDHPGNQHWAQQHHHYEMDRNRGQYPESYYNQAPGRQEEYERRSPQNRDYPSNYWNEFNDRSYRDRRWDDENRFRFERSHRYNKDNEK